MAEQKPSKPQSPVSQAAIPAPTKPPVPENMTAKASAKHSGLPPSPPAKTG